MNALPATDEKAIAVFGGSGGTGRALIALALDGGLRVRALVRHPGSVNRESNRIKVIPGSLTNAEDVFSALNGCTAAICAFGPHPHHSDIFCEEATANIVAGMKELGIQRLVCQTGAMIGDYPDNRTHTFQLMAEMFKRQSSALARDRDGQESAVMHSGLAWTIVKPPRLTNGRARGKWTAGPDIRVGLLSSIARDDLAAFLLEETLMPCYIGQKVFIRR